MPHTSRDPFRPQRMPLTELPVGAAGRVCALQGEPDVCSRLRENGILRVGRDRERFPGRATLLCDLYGTRIALQQPGRQTTSWSN